MSAAELCWHSALRAAALFEAVQPWSDRRPSL